jgi:hypothetical protein
LELYGLISEKYWGETEGTVMFMIIVRLINNAVIVLWPGTNTKPAGMNMKMPKTGYNWSCKDSSHSSTQGAPVSPSATSKDEARAQVEIYKLSHSKQ